MICRDSNPASPETSPQRARNAARQNERDQRIMLSPEHRRLPIGSPIRSAIAGPIFRLQPDPAPAQPPPPNDLLPAPFIHGRELNHLPNNLRMQHAALPAIPVPARRGPRRNRAANNVCNVYSLFT